MFAKLSTVIMVLFCATANSTANAGPSVSGGVPPHPALRTMSLEAPIPGVDFPTDAPTRVKAVLVLWEKRVLIYDVVPGLEQARAGVDFPTDSRYPFWKVLILGDRRLPVYIAVGDKGSYWRLPGDTAISVKNIAAIERARAGIDFPTDGPSDMDRDFFVLVLHDGSRVRL